MKFYVAGSWEEESQISNIISKVESRGHQITRDWTDHDDIEDFSTSNLTEEYSVADVKGASGADVFVLAPRKISRGSHLELGVAIESSRKSSKPEIFVLSKGREIDHLFYHHPEVQRAQDIEEVLELVER